jgi:hypothetical protein
MILTIVNGTSTWGQIGPWILTVVFLGLAVGLGLSIRRVRGRRDRPSWLLAGGLALALIFALSFVLGPTHVVSNSHATRTSKAILHQP